MEMVVIEDKGKDYHHHHYYRHKPQNSPSFDNIPKNLYDHVGKLVQHHLSHTHHQKSEDNHGQHFRDKPTIKHTHEHDKPTLKLTHEHDKPTLRYTQEHYRPTLKDTSDSEYEKPTLRDTSEYDKPAFCHTHEHDKPRLRHTYKNIKPTLRHTHEHDKSTFRHKHEHHKPILRHNMHEHDEPTLRHTHEHDQPTLRHTHKSTNGQDLFRGFYNIKQQHNTENPHIYPPSGRNQEIDDSTEHQQLHDIEIAHDSGFGKRLRNYVSKYPSSKDEGQSYQSSFRNEAAGYATEMNDKLGYNGFMVKGLDTSTQFGDDSFYRKEPKERKRVGQNSFNFPNDITILPFKGLKLSIPNFNNE